MFGKSERQTKLTTGVKRTPVILAIIAPIAISGGIYLQQQQAEQQLLQQLQQLLQLLRTQQLLVQLLTNTSSIWSSRSSRKEEVEGEREWVRRRNTSSTRRH